MRLRFPFHQFQLALLAVAFFGCVQLSAQAPPALSQVRVEGNHFVTADGKSIRFTGLDAPDPDKLQKEGRWDQRYFEAVKEWGANIVRFPVHPRAWRERGGEAYLRLLDQGVQWAADNGLYVIIDWHSIGNLETEKYQAAMYETTKEETRDFWARIAERYTHNHTVAFFELFNEPTTMGGKLGDCSWTQWKVLMEGLIRDIRATGATAIPLVAGFNWAYDLRPVADSPINAAGIAYVSHPYPQKRPKPWVAAWTEDWGFVADKYPVFLTEIGFCGPDEKGAHVPVISDESYGDAITAYAREKGISYTVWVFDPQWAPMLIEDWYFTPTRQGRYFKKALQAETH